MKTITLKEIHYETGSGLAWLSLIFLPMHHRTLFQDWYSIKKYHSSIGMRLRKCFLKGLAGF